MSGSSMIAPFLAAPGQPAIPGRPAVQTVPSPRQKRPWRVEAWAYVKAAYRRHRSRHLLTQLDAHLLKDIGVTFVDAETEANKPFWRG